MLAAASIPHLLAHLAIFVGYLVAIALVVPAFSALIRLRLATKVSGGGFFLFCGITHGALALGRPDAPLVAATDHLQAVAIVLFIVLLTRDLMAANRRLDQAFADIGGESSTAVAAALQGVSSRP